MIPLAARHPRHSPSVCVLRNKGSAIHHAGTPAVNWDARAEFKLQTFLLCASGQGYIIMARYGARTFE